MIPKDHKALQMAMLVSGLALLVLFGTTSQKSANDPPTVVRHVDLDRHLGKWYEIARYPNRFQKACVASTAAYQFARIGRIRVLNDGIGE